MEINKDMDETCIFCKIFDLNSKERKEAKIYYEVDFKKTKFLRTMK